MAKLAAPQETRNGMLPVPARILEHHLTTLAPAMQEWATGKRFPPVVLLTGPSGIGKRELAHHLAQWLCCHQGPFAQTPTEFGDLLLGLPQEPERPTSPSITPCQTCPGCLKALHGTWVDFEEIRTEEDQEAGPSEASLGLLKIDLFRDLKSTLGFGAHESPFRITLIPNAERMTEQAANALLKLLEEPPPSWILLLTASDAQALLPTLVSRCLRVRLRPLETELLAQHLESEGLDAPQARLLAQLGQGSLKKARSFEDPELWGKRAEILQFLQRPAAGLANLVDWGASEPANLAMLTDQLESLCRDLARWSLSPQATGAWENPDAENALVPWLRKASPESLNQRRDFWLEQARELAKSRLTHRVPLNRKLQLQALLLPWVEAV